MNINDVFIKCVEKWAENELDDRINFAMDKFDDWIKDFDEEEKDILCKILEKFNYYPLWLLKESKDGYGGKYISGEDYQKWLMICTRYLQHLYPNDPQTEYFTKVAERANGNDDKNFDILISILNAIKELPVINSTESIDDVFDKIFTNFHRCTRSILNRHGDRETIEIKDEYDVQDLLEGILRIFVDDIRPEDYVPSYAGGNSRTDFYLPKYDMYIETKMTRTGLKDKEVGEELIIDVARYKEKCKKLICFIYDKESFLKNPYGLIHDLENLSNDNLDVKVYISPL